MKKSILLGSVLSLAAGIFIASHFTDITVNARLLTAQVIGAFTKTDLPYSIAQSKIDPEVFTFKYPIFAGVSLEKGQKYFDIAILPFDEQAVQKAAIKNNIQMNFGSLRDAWGYPVHENAYMKLGASGIKTEIPTKTTTQKTSLGNKIQNFFVPVAFAADANPSVPGLVNCRANTGVTGYFEAYFEDVAVHNNKGYDHPTFGAARRNAACQALQDLSILIKLDTTTVTPDILFQVDPGNIPSNALAAASSYFGNYFNGADNGLLHKHIISHIDPTPILGKFDAFIITNFGSSMQWDTDSSLNANTFSLSTVITHEAMHALGFTSLLPAVIPTTNVIRPYTTFDSGLSNNAVVPRTSFFNAVTHVLQTPVGAPSPWFTTNATLYQGQRNIISAGPGPIDPVYSPASWQQGSSLAHFDMARSSGQSYVMNPTTPPNTVQALHADEKEVLCQQGYAVLGLAGCDVPTPIANDDFGYLGSGGALNPACIDVLVNDTSFTTGALTMYSLQISTVQTGDTIQYFSDSNCTGSVLSAANGNGAKSLRFTPGANQSSRTLFYTVTDSVSRRISAPARIYLTANNDCTTDPDEYVCNGGLENPFTIPPPRSSGISVFYCGMVSYPVNTTVGAGCNVPYWGSAEGSPDLYSSLFPASISTTLPVGALNSPNGGSSIVGNLRIKGTVNAGYNGDYIEAAQGILKAPLTVGKKYQVSFDVILTSLPDTYSIDQTIGIAANVTSPVGCIELDTTANSNSVYSSTTAAPYYTYCQNVQLAKVGSSPWTHVSYTFTATAPYQFLRAYGDYQTINNSINLSGNLIDTQIYAFFDNFSIKPASNTSISGIVYNDQNKDGRLSGSETGLSGVNVRLYSQTNTTAPLQVVQTSGLPDLGKYVFNNVPDGNYFVVLGDENLYSQVTQPGVNNINGLLPGYTHINVISVSSGYPATNLNFGVTLATAIDVCPNVAGVQTTVPSGYQLINGKCYQVVVLPQQPTRIPLPVFTPGTPSLPDLIVDNFTWTPTNPRVRVITNPANEPSPNTNFQVVVTIKNIGTAPAILPQGTQVSISENTTVYGASQVFSTPVTIPAGQTYTIMVYQLSVPNIRATSRTFTLTAKVDDAGNNASQYQVLELNEQNNSLSKSITILP